MLEIIKLMLTHSTKDDKANFYTLESIRNVSNKTYHILNCTKGFLSMIVKSGLKYKIVDNAVTVYGEGTATAMVEMEGLTAELLKLKKKGV